MDKSTFVTNELFNLCKKCNSDIVSLLYIKEYYTDEVHYEEYVQITFKNKHHKKVCVTGDSFKAMTIDVLRQIG